MQSSQHISSYELYRIINSGFSLDNQQQVNWEDWKDNLLKLSMHLPIMSKVNYYAHVNSVLRDCSEGIAMLSNLVRNPLFKHNGKI